MLLKHVCSQQQQTELYLTTKTRLLLTTANCLGTVSRLYFNTFVLIDRPEAEAAVTLCKDKKIRTLLNMSCLLLFGISAAHV